MTKEAPDIRSASATERLAAIRACLLRKGQVCVFTYTQAITYTLKHLDWFTLSANGKDLYVRRGKGKDCLNFTTIRLSR